MTEPMPASSAPRAGARLTPSERIDRATTGAELQRLVTDLATLLGWEWVHLRPAQTNRGWRTPVEGPLGKGWPDLTLVRARDRRLIFAELKRQTNDPVTAEQAAVLALLGELDWRRVLRGKTPELSGAIENAGPWALGRVECHVFRPSDLSDGTIEAVLRGGKP